jgi:DNA polymerase III subunit gamma/tau
MYTALYREWRPKVFEDLIGQDYIVKLLRNQILTDRIAHAYLFCGTRGTGKTSTAKILSKAVNCLDPQRGDPCGKCEMCNEINTGTLIDVVEIDAASNNRVENIRDLIEDVKYPPHSAKYKVYIIDEVHMLSISAFNALLKTLEEPPAHVIFILATTDPQKVPATILSRCQRFDFKRIKTEDVFLRLRKIVDENGVYAEDKTLKAIARLSDGAMRDALSVLDQCMSMSSGKIEYEDIAAMLGLTSYDHIFKLTDLMIEKNIEAVINEVDEVIFSGKDIVQYIKDLIKHFRNLIMVKISKKPNEIIDLSEDVILSLQEQAKKIRNEELMRGINIFADAENDCKTTSQPRIRLEMALIKFCRRELDASPEMLLHRISVLEEKLKTGDFVIAKTEQSKQEALNKLNSLENTKTTGKQAADGGARNLATQSDVSSDSDELFEFDPNATINMDEIIAAWQEVISYLNANKNKVVSMLLTQGRIIKVAGHTLTVEFEETYSINKRILDQVDKKKIAEEAFAAVMNKVVKLNFCISKTEINDMDQSLDKIRKVLGDDLIEVIE